MANVKITQLPLATTPLTGTEVFPLVQGTTTKQVAITGLFTSPVMTNPTLGTVGQADLINATGLPISTGVAGLGTGVATFLGTPSSSNLRAAVTDETGTGSLVFATSPTLVTPNLGTPSVLVATNATGTAVGLTAGSAITNANLTGAVTSVGNATSLGSFTSAQLRTALTDETGSGSAVFATSPTITAPILNQINDTNNAQILGLSPTTSAVDYFVVKNGIGVGVPLHFYADGSSANIGLHIQPKGTGLVTISDGTDFNKGIRFRSSSSAASAITLLDAVSTAGRVVTLPDATTTLVGRDTTDTLTNKTIAFSSNTFSGTLAIANGGTGQATANAALNALLPAQTGNASKYLQTNGTDSSWDAISLSTADITGTLGTANGGTGLTSFTSGGVVYASSTSALATGSALTWDGSQMLVKGNERIYFNTYTNSTTHAGFIGRNTSTGNFEIGSQTIGGNYPIDFFVGTQASMKLSNSGVFNWYNGSGGDRMVLNSTGLGIGTSSPAYKLDVTGNGNFTSLLTLAKGSSSGLTIGDVATNSNSVLRMQGTSAGYNFQIANNLNVGGFELTPSTATGGTTYTNPVYSVTGLGLHKWFYGTTQAMTLDASGNLGIGTSSPSVKLDVVDATNVYRTLWLNETKTASTRNRTGIVSQSYTSTFPAQFMLMDSNTSVNDIYIGGGFSGAYAATNLLFYTAANNTTVTGTQRMVIDSAGNLGLGVTPSAWSGATALQMPNNFAYSSFGVLNNGYYNGTSWIYSTSSSASRYTQSGGQHIFYNAASGTAGNAITFTQAMTLDASGNLGVGTTSPTSNGSGNTVLDIASGSAKNANLWLHGNNASGSSTGFQIQSASDLTAYLWNFSNAAMVFGTNNTERARIDSSGNLLVNTTNANLDAGVGIKLRSSATIPVVGVVGSDSTNSNSGYTLYSTGAAAYRFFVTYGGTINATSTTITAISDQRLKENVRDIDTGLNSIMALKPRRFDWKEGKGQDKKDVAGFIAQEFEDVFPECVGTSMAGADGIEYKNINHETLIPTLVKAIQELKAEFDAYKASHP